MATELRDDACGLWMVTTASGTKHCFDMDARTVVRIPAGDSAQLRRDTDAVGLKEIVSCKVGLSGWWVLDVTRDPSIDTLRASTEIVSIEPVVG